MTEVRKRAPWTAVLAALPLALIVGSAGAHHPGGDRGGPAVPLREFIIDAEFVFRGRVTSVEYRNSETVPVVDAAGAPRTDDEGQPIFQDGSDLPHTFVTYRIERVYKGKAEGRQLTLRFIGGLDEEPLVLRNPDGSVRREPQAYGMSGAPLFDVGDRDILFVKGNAHVLCPLVACEASRFRLIDGRVFSDQGDEIVSLGPTRRGRNSNGEPAGLGPPRQLDAVRTNLVGPISLVQESEREPSGDVFGHDSEPALPPRTTAPQFDEKAFDKLVATLARKADAEGSQRRAPITSADASQPFVAAALEASGPRAGEVGRPTDPPRPELDGLSSEQQTALIAAAEAEQRALEANGGNPVLPTPAG